MRILAERLKTLRQESGLSIFELSQKISISVASLCRWENGTTDIKSDQLIILAEFFQVSVDYLLGLED